MQIPPKHFMQIEENLNTSNSLRCLHQLNKHILGYEGDNLSVKAHLKYYGFGNQPGTCTETDGTFSEGPLL